MDPISHGGWEGPRRVTLERNPQGFGFTLRQFIVYPPEASIAEHNRLEDERQREDPSYVRTELAPMDTIFIKQVRDGSPASRAGLTAGERVVSVDGENISGKKYETVVDSLQSRNNSITLEVVPKSDDILQVAYPNSSLRSARRTLSNDDRLPKSDDVPTSPNSAESGFLSDDDILIVGGRQNSEASSLSRRRDSERSEVHIPLKTGNGSTSSPQRFLVSGVSSSVGGEDDSSTDGSVIVLPTDGTIQIQGLRPSPSPVSPQRTQSKTQSSPDKASPISRTIGSEDRPQLKPSRPVYPQRTFRLTGVLGSPPRPNQGKPVVPGGSGGRDQPGTSSPMGKYNPCVNVLPNKPVLVRVDASHVGEERGDTRTPGVPVRLRVTPPSQQVLPPSSQGRAGSNPNIVNISNSNEGQVRIRVKDPFFQEAKPVYSSSTSSLDSPNMILDASQPTVKLSKTLSPADNSAPENLSSSMEVLHQNSNRKYSDPIAVQYNSEKLKPFHSLELTQVNTRESRSNNRGKGGKRDESDGRLRKFLFQTSATIDVRDPEKGCPPTAEGSPPDRPSRGSSRGRVRERSLEREKKERSVLERKQRSQSYDRNYHRKNAKNQSIRQHAIYAERSQETQIQRPPRPRARSRKDSDPPSPRPEDKDPTAVFAYDLEMLVRSPSHRSRSRRPIFGISSEMVHAFNQVSKNYVSRRTSYLKATDVDKEDLSTRSLPSGSYEETGFLSGDLRVLAEGQKASDLALQVNEGSSKTPSEGGEVIKEGPLSVKMDFKDGKRFADRSWRSVWAKLINNTLYLYRDNKDSAGNTIDVEAHPVDIDEAMVDVAYGYVKKKNVFRLCTVGGTDYLFNVTDMDTMLSWIRCIQTCRDSASENKHVINEDLLLRRAGLHESKKQAPPRTPSPNDTQKRASAKRNDTKDTANNMKKMAQRHSKKARRPLPPTQEEMVNDSQTFGLTLEECPSSAVHEYVPIFVERCCSIVETHGLDVVGVYRVPGNNAGISHLKAVLKNDIRGVDFEDERWRDVNVVSSMLKLFFRKLPEPLIPSPQYTSFIAANRTPDPAGRMAALRHQIHSLPEPHFATLQFLARHLKLVSSCSDVNRMEVRNLAIVFGPTLIRTADDGDMVTMVRDMSDQCRIVESVVDHCAWFFCEDVESQQSIPLDAMLPGADVMTDTNVMLAKARSESRSSESTISPKDIVASVLSAANRKLKRPDRRSFEAPRETDEKDGGSSGSSSKQSTHTRNSSRTESQSTEADSVTCSDGFAPGLTPTLLSKGAGGGDQAEFDSLMSQGDFTFGSVRGRTRGGGGGDHSPNSKTRTCPDTELMRTQKHHPPNGGGGEDGCGGGDVTINWMTRVDNPASGVAHLLKKSNTGEVCKSTMEFSKERLRIEAEHRLALQDYEKEEESSSNLAEIVQSKERLKTICSTENTAAPDVVASKGETASVTSDYSTTSSNNNNGFPEGQAPQGEVERKGSQSLTPDSNVSQGSSEDSEFFRSIAAAFEAKYQTFFPKDAVGGSKEGSTAEQNLERSRSKSFTTGGAPLAADKNSQEQMAGSPTRPTTLGLADRSNSVNISSQSTPRTPQKKTMIEVTLVFEKSEVTPTPALTVGKKNSNKISHSLESSPEKSLSPAEKRERNRKMRRRRHTLGGPNDARSQKIVEITLVGEHTATTPAQDRSTSTPARRVKSSRSFGKADSCESSAAARRRRNCSSNPNLIDDLLDSGRSLTLPAKKRLENNSDCHPQKLNGKQEFFEIPAAL